MGLVNYSISEHSGTEVVFVDGVHHLEESKSYNLCVKSYENSAQVWLDAISLKRRENGIFVINIGHWVGESKLVIDVDGNLYTIPIIVQPREEKIDVSSWAVMLQEIEEWLPGVSLGGEGGVHGAVGNEGVGAPLLAEALIPLLPSFEKALRVLLNQPRQLDKTIWIEQYLSKIRGCSRDMMTWLAKHPDVGVWLDPWKMTEFEGHGPKIPVRRSIDSIDHPANQYIAWLLFRVIKKLRTTQNYLQRISVSLGGSDETALWCTVRSQRIESWLQRIEKIYKCSFLNKVSKTPASESALLTLFDDPAYARVHAIGRLFVSPLFKLAKTEDALGAAVKPSYSIYEIWCFLFLVNAFKKQYPDWCWKEFQIKKILSPMGTGAGAVIVGTPTTNDKRLEILFNPRFVSYQTYSKSKEANKWSLSSERRPDIVVSFKDGETEGSWLFFDAKYRVGKNNLGDAFTSLHVYRDALRYDGFGGCCRAGGLLSPAMTRDSKVWFEPTYREQFLSGVWELKPGSKSCSEIVNWIWSMLCAN